VPESATSDLAALQKALDALNTLQVAIKLVREHLAALQRQVKGWDWVLIFDSKREFVGVSRKGTNGEIEFPADSLHCVEIRSDCEWLPKHVDSLWEAQPAADRALAELPASVTNTLDALTGSPWLASVRRHCLDKMLAWPGEKHHQTSMAAEKVHGSVTDLLEKAEKYDPFPTWEHFEELILGYKSDLIAVRHAALPRPATPAASHPARLGGLVAVNIRQVIEDANLACKAWHVLGGGWDGRMLEHRPNGSPAPHSDSQPKCIRAWFVPNKDDRKEIKYTEKRTPDGEERVVMCADEYRKAFKHYWNQLNDARRRLVALLYGGDIAVLDCDLETRDTLKTMWSVIETIPDSPPEFRIEGKQDFGGNTAWLLGSLADELESRLQPKPPDKPAAPLVLQGPDMDLDSEEAAIVALLREVGHRLTTSQILSEFSKRNEPKAESTTKLKLSQLVRRRVLNNRSDSQPRGYSTKVAAGFSTCLAQVLAIPDRKVMRRGKRGPYPA